MLGLCVLVQALFGIIELSGPAVAKVRMWLPGLSVAWLKFCMRLSKYDCACMGYLLHA